jgi:carbon monoxide dehydrogenase subunit G
MQLTGEYRIEAPREQVWQALNDPEILKLCIPGCEELERTSDDGFAAKVKAKVGPVSAKFAGAVTLSELNPPESYTISGEGKGGAAGFAKGGAKVHLAEDGAATTLSYEVDAQVGGKLAQIGSRLISGTAKKMADDFFGTFAELVGGPAEAPEEEAPMEAAPRVGDAGTEEEAARSLRMGVWITGLLCVVLLLLAFFGLG